MVVFILELFSLSCQCCNNGAEILRSLNTSNVGATFYENVASFDKGISNPIHIEYILFYYVGNLLFIIWKIIIRKS